MKLYFENSSGELREIATLDGGLSQDDAMDAALRIIRVFCEERHFRIFYIRWWESHRDGEPMFQFDVGSHTEFFFLEKP